MRRTYSGSGLRAGQRDQPRWRRNPSTSVVFPAPSGPATAICRLPATPGTPSAVWRCCERSDDVRDELRPSVLVEHVGDEPRRSGALVCVDAADAAIEQPLCRCRRGQLDIPLGGEQQGAQERNVRVLPSTSHRTHRVDSPSMKNVHEKCRCGVVEVMAECECIKAERRGSPPEARRAGRGAHPTRRRASCHCACRRGRDVLGDDLEREPMSFGDERGQVGWTL